MPGSLISAADLADALRRPVPPVVIDVRWRLAGPSTRPDYLEGHLPGAVWADLDRDLADPPGAGGRHPLPDPGRLEQSLRRWGIDEGSRVVVYDDADAIAAARAWWVLRWAGLADVQVLDGGLRAWVGAGLPLEPGDVTPDPGLVTVRPGAMPTIDAAVAAAWADGGLLLDVRTPERFRGEAEPIDPVAGRIGGAVNAPAAGNNATDGRLLDPAALRARFESLGVQGTTPVAAYCGSGVTAAQTVLALDQIGVRAALYPGSWSEWITDPARPITTGPA